MADSFKPLNNKSFTKDSFKPIKTIKKDSFTPIETDSFEPLKKSPRAVLREYDPTLTEKVKRGIGTWMKKEKPSFPPIEIIRKTLFKPDVKDKKERQVQQLWGSFLNTAALGLPHGVSRWAGVKPPKPETTTEKVLAGAGALGGFIKGAPIKLGSKIAKMSPVISKAFKPASTLGQAIYKPILRSAATLGTAEALMTPKKGIFAPKERLKQYGRGATTGAAFGGISFIPNKAARIMTSSTYLGLPSTLTNQPLEQQIFNYGLGAWFGRHGRTPKQVLKQEQPLALLQYGAKNPEKFFKSNRQLLKEQRRLAKESGKKPISRKKKFDKLTNIKKVYEHAQDAPYYKKLRKQKTDYIYKRIRKLKRNPKFQLETGEVNFLVDYISKDLGLRKGDISKLSLSQLYNVSEILRNYSPSIKTPFHKEPPLKRQFANKDIKRQINLWDRTFRPGLMKLQKLGLGKYPLEGLTGEFFISAANKARFINRYNKMRNNWIRVVGYDKRRSNDIFNYLDGKMSTKQLRKTHGSKAVNVAKQMRYYLDTLLTHINRHRAAYNEKPIKKRKNYITHIFKDFQREIKQKKYPFPDWLADAMPYIIPKKKFSPYTKARKGAKGYQKDIWTALDTYVYRTAQVIGDIPVRKAYKINRFIQKQIRLNKRKGKKSPIDWVGIRKNLDEYVRDVQGRQGKLDKVIRSTVDPINKVLEKLPRSPQIRSVTDVTNGMISLLYGSQMAYRPKLPIRNLGQHSLIVGQTGFKPLTWAMKVRRTPEIRRILSKSHLLASRERAFAAESQATFGRKAIQKVIKPGLKPFRLADKKNVVDAYLAGYKQAKMQGKSNKQAYKRGDEVAALTQYIYLPENRSDLARSWRLSKILGRPLSVFTTWPSNWVEFNIASAKPEHRKNLMKYWATALGFTALSAGAGIKGASYVGITSPLQLLRMFRGELPIAGVAGRPRIQILEELKDLASGEKDLMDILFYTFRK